MPKIPQPQQPSQPIMREPTLMERIKNTLLGVTSSIEDQPLNQLLGPLSPIEAVKNMMSGNEDVINNAMPTPIAGLFPASLARQYGENFRKVVPPRLAATGDSMMANIADDLAGRFPHLFGHLSNLTVRDMAPSTMGQYQQITQPWSSLAKDARWVSAPVRAQQGKLPVLGNRIDINSSIAQGAERFPEDAVQVREIMRHELAHLSQDIGKDPASRLVASTASGKLPYLLKPEEILARANENSLRAPFSDKVVEEFNRGLSGTTGVADPLDLEWMMKGATPEARMSVREGLDNLIDLISKRIQTPLQYSIQTKQGQPISVRVMKKALGQTP